MKFRQMAIAAACCALVVSCTDKELQEFASHASGWELTLETVGTTEPEFTIDDSIAGEPSIRRGFKKIVFSYPALGEYKISLEYIIRRTSDGKAFEICPEIKNDQTGIMVKAFKGPWLKDYDINFDDYDLLVPYGPGRKFDQAPVAEDVKDFSNMSNVGPGNIWKWIPDQKVYQMCGRYPSSFGASMQWYTFTGKDSGLYVGSHDPDFTYKNYMVRFDVVKRTLQFCWECWAACLPGESWSVPSTLVWEYDGSWHNCADYYREWFLAHKEICRQPEWFKKSSGWLLAILKQQNAEILWNYDEICGPMEKVADEHGLDMIGLFGWASGGHDRHYPDYIPDPEMGGREAIKESLARLKAKGKHAVIYANGIMIDKEGTRYWPDTGQYISVLRRDSTLWKTNYRKYHDAPDREFGIACLATDTWRNRMLAMAKQANELGADGMIFDCLGTGNRDYCYNPDHGHKVPMVAHENDLYGMLDYIRTEMQKINPDFIIMTEGMSDVEMAAINCFHFCGYGIYWIWPDDINAMVHGSDGGCHFPEMIRYTFPEMTSTCRIPSDAITPETLFYDTMFGFRSEIECRYAADRRYLVDRIIPQREDYGNVIDVSNLQVLQNQDYGFIKDLHKSVMDFQRKYSDLLWNGRYMDTLGFSMESSSKYIMARAFTSGNRMGIVIWNSSADTPAEFSLSVTGYELVSTDSPVPGASVPGKLPAQSMQLQIFEK